MKRARFGRVGVLAGGPSNERKISLISGKAVHSALIREGIDAIFLDVQNGIYDTIKPGGIDVAFIALHGRFGEDGTVQSILEEAAIPYTGSGPKASGLAIDKIASKDIFFRQGIPAPRHIVFRKDGLLSGRIKIDEASFLGLPVVVKPQMEGSSIGLSVVRDPEMLEAAIDKAFEYGPNVILEEFIDGRELTVGILDEAPLPVIEIVAKNRVYDYAAKYDDLETRYLVPAPIDAEVFQRAQDLGRRAHEALGLRSFSRIDMMMDRSGGIFVLEANTIPGMTERSLLPKAAGAIGIGFGRLCVKLLENALR